MQVSIREAQLVPINALHPNEWNPNVCSEGMLAELVKEIREDGFDQPLQVVPCRCDKIAGDHWMIIGGEHRLKAAHILGMLKLPVVVYDGWQDAAQKIKTVRRNMLHGDLDARKFTKLVHDLEEDGYNQETLARLMAFDSEAALARHILEETQATDKKMLQEYQESAQRDMTAMDSLTDVIQTIFRDSGETVNQGFLAFAYKGKTHVLVLMSPELDATMGKLVETLKLSGANMNDVLLAALERNAP